MIATTTVEVVDTVVVDAVTMMDTVADVMTLITAATTVVTTAMITVTVALIATQVVDAMTDTALVEVMTVVVMIAVADMIATMRALMLPAMEMHHLLANLVRDVSPVNPVNLVRPAKLMAVAPMKVAAVIDMDLGKWTS